MTKWLLPLETERLRIPGDEDEWIEIKKRFTVQDQDALKEKLVEVEFDGLNREERRRLQRQGGIRARYRLSTVALLSVAIVDWSFKDERGNKIPVTEENIGRLDPSLAAWLEDEIDKRNPLGTLTSRPNTITSSRIGR